MQVTCTSSPGDRHEAEESEQERGKRGAEDARELAAVVMVRLIWLLESMVPKLQLLPVGRPE